MDITIEEGMLRMEIDTAVYSIDVIFKCFYWYTGKFDISITNKDNSVIVAMSSIPDGETITETYIAKIRRDLIDFKLRSIVAEETKTVRELIIAKAFAYYDMATNPTTDISDPVGFNPELL